MTTPIDDHVWTQEALAAAIAGGLSPAEQARFDAHLAACESCRSEFDSLRCSDEEMRALLSHLQPPAGLEDRLIQRLRLAKAAHWFIHPMVRYAGSGIAAAIMLGTLGYVVSANNGRPLQYTGGYARVEQQPSYGLGYRGYPATQPLALSFDNGVGTEFGAFEARRAVTTTGNDRVWDESGRTAGERGRQSEERFGRAMNRGETVLGVPVQKYPAAGRDMGLAKDQKAKGAEVANGPVSGGDLHVFFAQPTDGPAAGYWYKPADASKELAGKEVANAPVMSGVMVVNGNLSDSSTVAVGEKVSPVAPPATPAAGERKRVEPAPQPPVENVIQNRKIIRNGAMEFEVERYDSAFAQVSKIAAEAGGYLASTQSEKLPNGKVKGTVTLRIPPERLDTVMLQLRGIGDLKTQKLDAQDVTKQYQDLGAQLMAAKAMESRLLDIIKNAQGQIKDLLAAEKELATWRTKIETLTGEMKYYDNLVALSTLNVTLYEKDIKTPAAAIETEAIDTGLETQDVEKSRADALKAIDEAQGRVIQSDLKKHDAGQLTATIIAEVAPDRAGPLLDRIKQLGKVARLDVQRKQTASGDGAATRVEKQKTRINLSLYNLANVAPRVSTAINLAADDVEVTYRAVIARVEKAGGRIVNSNLNRQKDDLTSGTIAFEVPAGEADAIQDELEAAGQAMKLATTENPDVNNVTTAKRGFNLQLLSTAAVAPREAQTLQTAAANVVEARTKLLDAARAAGARILASQLNETDRRNVSANVDLELKRERLGDFEKALAGVADVISRNTTRSTDTENTLDSKLRLQISLIDAARVAPRQITRIDVETSNVEDAMSTLLASVPAGARIAQSNLTTGNDGRTIARLAVESPLGESQAVIDRARGLGTVRTYEVASNPNAPEGRAARAQLEIALASPDTLGPQKGIWGSVRQALSTSFAGLLWSLELVIIGLCFVLPIVLVIWGAWKMIRWTRKAPAGGA